MNRKIQFAFFLLCIVSLQSCKYGRFAYYNFANITDHKIFPARPLHASAAPFVFPEATSPLDSESIYSDSTGKSFDQVLKDNHSVAFLIIQNDSIQYERYFNKYDEASIVASFSMAKSITSMLIGIAIDDGLIRSVDEPITNYIPEFKANGLENVTIKHLLQMTAGLKFTESYSNPFGDAANYYYGTNLRKALKKVHAETAPGQKFAYKSGETQVLGLVLERALKDRSITSYLDEKVWRPLGMEYDASWSLDRKKEGLEKTFCCLNARARDFAKLGRLYLQKGNWNGQQIVSEQWVKESTKVDTTEGSSWRYQYQWWLPSKDGDFYADGMLGQYIYVHPEKDLIIVRLGKKRGDIHWTKFIPELAAKL
ncbi:serine hydrolase [Sphingobacterium sp. UT-1RO-CII-1]|uniref:serine hydrolase domain-containing protein n=1 Tax=Sphingobacterium sp. UT-1RO-CII-1 TaxID=2995225 RepID=UPI00227D4D13|nr:serine hydrolase [Sphingobacterium sp. UT-1RO-CII-1]MCY4780489.1 serine hydrolase [Sphingobacterium sp. UT-1RO-CII-1]